MKDEWWERHFDTGTEMWLRYELPIILWSLLIFGMASLLIYLVTMKGKG